MRRVRRAVTSSETSGGPSIWGVTLTPPPSMATCDDDFGLLGDDAHPQPETQPGPSPPPPPLSQQQQRFYLPQKPPLSSCFADDDAASHFSPAARSDAQTPDRKKHQQAAKRSGGAEEESGDGGEYCSYFSYGGGQSSKKGRGGGSGSGSASSAPGVDYRKDREEWSDEAIGSLLDAYSERFEQLKRGNLRGRDWEDVAAAVTKQQQQHKDGGGWGKSVEQCKNKIDNLKKRFKVECQRIAGSSSGTSSQWPWFKKLEFIVGNATSILSPKPTSTDDDKLSRRQQQNNKSCIPSSAAVLSIGVGSRLTPFSNPRWKRALLKIGGTALVGAASENVDPKVIMLIAREVQVASHHGVQVAIVVGSQNIYCGDTWTAATGIDRAATCPIGMMASVMNAVLLQASLEKIGVETRVQTSLRMQDVTEPYIRQRAMRHLEKGRVVIFGGIGASMGNPLFTTDTAAALRASEINADVVLKGTAGDTPGSNSNATFEHISYRELVARGFSSMDVTAITFCEENNVPVVLFNMLEPGNISRALCGDQVGTLVDKSGRIG